MLLYSIFRLLVNNKTLNWWPQSTYCIFSPRIRNLSNLKKHAAHSSSLYSDPCHGLKVHVSLLHHLHSFQRENVTPGLPSDAYGTLRVLTLSTGGDRMYTFQHQSQSQFQIGQFCSWNLL